MKLKTVLLLLMSVSLTISCSEEKSHQKENGLEFQLSVNTSNELVYSISKGNKTLMENAKLGITIDGEDIGKNVVIKSEQTSKNTEVFKINGNYSEVKSNYTETIYNLSSKSFNYKIIVRTFKDGIGFKYIIEDGNKQHTVTAENTEFKFQENDTIWAAKDYESTWDNYTMNTIKNSQKFAFPIMGKLNNNYILVSEAMALDYLAAHPKKKDTNTFGIGFDLLDFYDTSFQFKGELKNPWRVIMVNDNLNDLANNATIYKLADAPSNTMANTDWIKPGRAGWTWISGGFLAQNFEHMKAQITAVSKIGWEYMIIDDGWEHWDNKWEQVEKLCKHADSLNVKVILWKPTGDYKAEWQTKKFGDLDTIRGLLDDTYRKQFFQKAKQAGVAGLKVDFVNENNLERVNSVRTILEEAAKHQMIINFHGCSKPSGLERTYPNLIVQEAVRGMENVWKSEDLYHYNTVLPFTRYIIGSGDYTPVTGYENQAGSRAHQLALSVAIVAPLNAFGVSPIKLLELEELEFLKDIPVTWDETKVLPQSKIEDVAVIAKRKGSDWYLSVLNGRLEKNLQIDLSFFLEKGTYEMLSYSDTEEKNGLKKEKKTVNASETIQITAKVGGGFAARFKIKK